MALWWRSMAQKPYLAPLSQKVYKAGLKQTQRACIGAIRKFDAKHRHTDESTLSLSERTQRLVKTSAQWPLDSAISDLR